MSQINERVADYAGQEVRAKELTASTQINLGAETIVAADLTLLNALTASATQLNQYTLTYTIADGSAEATYYVVCPHAGTIAKIYTVTNGAVGTADITLTGKIGSTAITNGVVTIATAASAAGDVSSATPTAANVVTAGQAVNFVVTGGGSGGTPAIHLAVVITR